jgi:hypothetical protein
MRKGIVLAALCFLLITATAYAHLTGAFADYLTTIDEDGTTDKLKTEIQNTKNEIEKLTPRLNQLEGDYRVKQHSAVARLRFYSELGLDTWMNLVMKQESVVDMMGSRWLMENSLKAYLNELNVLYSDYKQLAIEKEVLAGHQDLLSSIADNLNMRQKFLAENSGLEIAQLGNYLDIDWTSEVEPALIPLLERDRERVKQELSRWAVPSDTASAAQGTKRYKFDGQWLNGSGSPNNALRYFFRSDHIYAVYSKKDIHVILIGQLLKESVSNDYVLQFEAGFFNGFLMPSTLIEELKGFTLEDSKLKLLPGVTAPFYMEQISGALQLR